MAAATGTLSLADRVWLWLAEVPDPEIPVVSVVDLGMIRNVCVLDEGVEVDVSPTYSGCPATEVIEHSIRSKLRDKGITVVSIRRVLSPPWTSDWITETGRKKLREYGIAPPVGTASKRALLGKRAVHCPRCGTNQTTVISEFGSTACKAAYKCNECLEPFEYFKCI
jgi:ring-1,2-phenylacetyl-CoA epoxidase subunit PaaD